MLAVFKTYV